MSQFTVLSKADLVTVQIFDNDKHIANILSRDKNQSPKSRNKAVAYITNGIPNLEHRYKTLTPAEWESALSFVDKNLSLKQFLELVGAKLISCESKGGTFIKQYEYGTNLVTTHTQKDTGLLQKFKLLTNILGKSDLEQTSIELFNQCDKNSAILLLAFYQGNEKKIVEQMLFFDIHSYCMKHIPQNHTHNGEELLALIKGEKIHQHHAHDGEETVKIPAELKFEQIPAELQVELEKATKNLEKMLQNIRDEEVEVEIEKPQHQRPCCHCPKSNRNRIEDFEELRKQHFQKRINQLNSPKKSEVKLFITELTRDIWNK